FIPAPWFEKQGLAWGIREEMGNPNTTDDALAWVDESDYYYIKVTNEPDPEGQKRTLVLDNLIHGYFILGHPERLDYDYEHIYALVTRRIAEAKAKAEGLPRADRAPLNTLFLGGGSYTFPRYLRHTYPSTVCEVAEIDPSVTRTNPARNVPRMLPTMPQAYTCPIAAPVRLDWRTRSTAILATTGLTVPIVIAGSRKTTAVQKK